MDPITSLPLLNWHAGTASEVIDQIRAAFDKILNDNRELEVVKDRPISKIIKTNGGYKLVSLTDCEGVDESFQRVIICSGFATEKALDKYNASYWDASDVAKMSGAAPLDIHGTGDGALIDLIRACTKYPSVDPWCRSTYGNPKRFNQVGFRSSRSLLRVETSAAEVDFLVPVPVIKLPPLRFGNFNVFGPRFEQPLWEPAFF